MQLSEWSACLLIIKLASYFAVAALAGMVLMRALNNGTEALHTNVQHFYTYVKRYTLVFLSIGLLASILQIPIEAGAMAEAGAAGMFDKFMLDIIWLSVIGDQALIRVPAFIFALIFVYLWQIKSRGLVNLNFLLTLLALGLISYSFTLIGHTSGENLLVKTTFTLHIIAVASWIGSLWPLYKCCQLVPINDVKNLMHRFGQIAIVIVFVLLSGGIILLWHKLNSFSQLFTTNYGQLILLKLFLVSAMLMLGAWHKLQLVPKIIDKSHVSILSRSILLESFIALAVLVTTSILSTLIGPPA